MPHTKHILSCNLGGLWWAWKELSEILHGAVSWLLTHLTVKKLKCNHKELEFESWFVYLGTYSPWTINSLNANFPLNRWDAYFYTSHFALLHSIYHKTLSAFSIIFSFKKKYKNTKLPLLKGLLWGTMLNASLTYLIPTATPWDKHCLLIFQDRETET